MNKKFTNNSWREVLNVFQEEFEKRCLDKIFECKILSLTKKFDEFSTLNIIQKSPDGINKVVFQIPLSTAHKLINKDRQQFFEKITTTLNC